MSVSFTVGLQCSVDEGSSGSDGDDDSNVEVMQVYVTFPSEAAEPPRNLRAFKKVAVPCTDSVGGSDKDVKITTVEVTLDQAAFEVWNNEAWSFAPGPSGTYTIAVGASSRDIRLEATVDL